MEKKIKKQIKTGDHYFNYYGLLWIWINVMTSPASDFIFLKSSPPLNPKWMMGSFFIEV